MRYAVKKGLLDHLPAAHVRPPRLDYESRVVGIDRDESARRWVRARVRRFVVAGQAEASEHIGVW